MHQARCLNLGKHGRVPRRSNCLNRLLVPFLSNPPPDRGSAYCPVTEDWPQLAAEGRDCPLDELCEIGNNRPSMDPLPKQLKRLRATRGLSQEALARKAHLSRGYLARIELGRHDPTLSVLRKLVKALKVRVGDLVGEQRHG